MFNRLYDKLKTREGWRYTEDFSYTAQPLLVPSTVIPQPLPISFQNVLLDLNAVPGNVAAYLVLRHVYMSVKKSIPYNSNLRGFSWSGFQNVTVPASASGNVQAFTINPSPFGMEYAKKLLISSVPAGITITKVEICPASNAPSGYVDLATGNITSPNGIDLESIFGTGYGLPANSRLAGTPGINVRFTSNNTNGSPTAFGYALYGLADTAQNSQYLVQYQDRNGGIHNVGIFDDRQYAQDFLVDRIIPIPITDPTRSDYGNLLFTTIIAAYDYYPGGDFYNVVLNASIAYLLPER